LSENAVYVGVNWDGFPNPQRDAVVRAYDLRNGQLIFQDRQTSKTVLDIAASGKRVLAVGSAGLLYPPDFAVWAYHLGRDRGPSGAASQD